MRSRTVLSAVVLHAAIGLASLDARAQEDVSVAAKAFTEGQQAQLRGEFVRAAELFEIADQAVPSAQALRSAIRNRGAAAQATRAATLALQALQRYPEDADTRTVAEETLTRFAPNLTRLRLLCTEPCTATLDGGLVGGGPFAKLEFFANPGVHVVRASWPGRPAVSESLESTAGQALEIALTAPPVARAPEPPVVVPAPTAPSTAPKTYTPSSAPVPVSRQTGGGGLSPAVFWVGVGLTAVSGGLVYWSGRDTLAKRDAYERNPTRARYEDGVDRERRTNLLIGGAAVIGVATLSIGLFATDWGGSSRVGLDVDGDRVAVSLAGALP